MENITKDTVEGGFWVGFANFLNRMGSLLLSIILARFFLPDLFGLYSLTLSIALVFMIIGDMGINEAVMRYISIQNKKTMISSYSRYLLKLRLLISLILSFLLLISAYPISVLILKKEEIFYPLIFSSAYIFISSFVFFFSLFFIAYRKTKYIGMKELIFQVLQITLIVLTFLFLPSKFYVIGVISSMIITNLIISLFLYFWIKKVAPHTFRKSEEKIDRINLLKYVGFASIATASGILFTYADLIILGFFVSFDFIGYYKVAFSLVFGVVSLFTYLGFILLPIFSRIEGKRIERIFNKILRFILIFTIPSSFGLIALGNYFLKVLYGDSYLSASIPLYILSLIIIIYLPSTFLSTIFFSKGKAKVMAELGLFMLALGIILDIIFISIMSSYSPHLTIIGAALACLISRSVTLIVMINLSKKHFNINIRKRVFLKPLFASLIMMIILTIFNRLFISDLNLFSGIVEVIFAVVFYFFIMFIIKGIVKDDLNVIKEIPYKDFFKILRFN